MAVDKANNSKLQPSLAFVMTTNTRTISSVIRGFYSVSYTPTTAMVGIMTADVSYSVTGGNGLFVNANTQAVTFHSDTIGTQIILYATDVDIATTTTSTIETISSSGTYTNTGTARVCAVGGGNSGGGSFRKNGGTGGGVAGGTIALPGSVPVTIGGGAPSTVPGDGWSGPFGGGSTIFGSITAGGGAGGAGSGSPGPNTPGQPGETFIAPTGFVGVLGLPSMLGGISGVGPGGNGTGGGIAAGGGWGDQGGAGGGGGVPGTNAAAQGVVGSSGGAGRVFLIRY